MSATELLIAAAMRADVEGLRVISQNVANADSLAYRRQVQVTHASFESLALEQLADLPPDAVLQTNTAVDPQVGAFRSTGRALDLAIDGSGFFVIETAQGPAFTRRGDFRVDAQGYLTTAAGQQVQGEQGPIAIGADSVTVDAQGWIHRGADTLDRLRIVEWPHGAPLQSIGDGAFQLESGAAPVESASVNIRAGFLETSNVSAVGETVRLLELMRHFEMAQRFARGYDQLLSSAIDRLGKL